MKTSIDLNGSRRRLDQTYLNFISEVDRQLRERSDYVGVCPYGSQWKHCTNESSDFDVMVICGDALVVTQNALSKQVQAIAKGFNGHGGGIPHNWTEDYFVDNFNAGDWYIYSHAVWPLLYPYQGHVPRLRNLRDLAIKKHSAIKKSDPRFAERQLEDAAKSAIYFELGVRISFNSGTITRSQPESQNKTCEKLCSRGFTFQSLRDVAVKRAWMFHERARKFLRD